MVNIEYRESIDEELGILINTGFVEFADKNSVVCDYSPFCFVAKENDEIIGIVTGHSYYGEVYISDLIILEQYRGKHIGRQLVDAVESHYKDKGFKHISLATYDFQAPDFYRKCGFQIEFVRNDTENPKLTKYFLIKRFIS